jgi:transcription initiation factor TFIIIB Brf1 subunit/transcription initiation factor TFIIB
MLTSSCFPFTHHTTLLVRGGSVEAVMVAALKAATKKEQQPHQAMEKVK